MKKLIFLLFVVSSFASASFDCQNSFMNHYEVLDSKSFVIHDDSLNADFDNDPVGYAAEAVESLLNKVEACKAPQQNKARESFAVKCQELVPGKAYSRSCFVESDMGYFFMSMDMLGNVNIVYNRWD